MKNINLAFMVIMLKFVIIMANRLGSNDAEIKKLKMDAKELLKTVKITKDHLV